MAKKSAAAQRRKQKKAAAAKAGSSNTSSSPTTSTSTSNSESLPEKSIDRPVNVTPTASTTPEGATEATTISDTAAESAANKDEAKAEIIQEKSANAEEVKNEEQAACQEETPSVQPESPTFQEIKSEEQAVHPTKIEANKEKDAPVVSQKNESIEKNVTTSNEFKPVVTIADPPAMVKTQEDKSANIETEPTDAKEAPKAVASETVKPVTETQDHGEQNSAHLEHATEEKNVQAPINEEQRPAVQTEEKEEFGKTSVPEPATVESGVALPSTAQANKKPEETVIENKSDEPLRDKDTISQIANKEAEVLTPSKSAEKIITAPDSVVLVEKDVSIGEVEGESRPTASAEKNESTDANKSLDKKEEEKESEPVEKKVAETVPTDVAKNVKVTMSSEKKEKSKPQKNASKKTSKEIKKTEGEKKKKSLPSTHSKDSIETKTEKTGRKNQSGILRIFKKSKAQPFVPVVKDSSLAVKDASDPVKDKSAAVEKAAKQKSWRFWKQ